MTANVYLSLFASHHLQYHNYIDVYTAQRLSIIVRCGVVCGNVSNYCLPASFFVFPAVFHAIETALKLIASSHSHFIIYSDSVSVLETLQSDKCSHTFISVLEHYNKLTKMGFNILFC